MLRRGLQRPLGSVAAVDLIDQIKQYARQELLDPLRKAPRWLAYGIAGSGLMMIGSVSLVLAVLRGLQTETGSWTQGNLSWLPYAISLVLVLAAIGLLAMRIGKRTL